MSIYNKIRSETNAWDKVEVAPIYEKLVESHHRLFGCVRRRQLEASVRVDQIEDSLLVSGRGRTRKIIWETIKKD